tara:strand:+ start:10138 stop:10542 length:405 start_codon:yes stop_codon:yes gene_type:complete
MVEIIINGENQIFGRLCSFAAKQTLEGNEIIIINSEKVIISGAKKGIIEKYKTLRAKGGHSQKGPKYIKIPYQMLKRGIRGMLPDYRKGIGKQAFSKIKCFDGIPKEFEGKEMKKVSKNLPNKYISLKELSERI